MDTSVVQSMARWPNVPACFDWLELDRRGEWRLGPQAPREKVAHAGLAEFIGRNYEHDGQGRWFMQNGPQRVYAVLEYTPWVYRLSAQGGLLTHTGTAIDPIRAWLDDLGNILLESQLGIGVLDDRDLPVLAEALCNGNGCPLSDQELTQFLNVDQAISGYLRWQSRLLPLSAIRHDQVADRFGFSARPGPVTN